jgi:Na+/proline symporter
MTPHWLVWVGLYFAGLCITAFLASFAEDSDTFQVAKVSIIWPVTLPLFCIFVLVLLLQQLATRCRRGR